MFGSRDLLEKIRPSIAIHLIDRFSMFIRHSAIERIARIALSVEIVRMVSRGCVGRSTKVPGKQLMIPFTGDTRLPQVPFPNHRVHDLLGVFQCSLVFIEGPRALLMVAENPHPLIGPFHSSSRGLIELKSGCSGFLFLPARSSAITFSKCLFIASTSLCSIYHFPLLDLTIASSKS